jgi:hypothetical protein
VKKNGEFRRSSIVSLALGRWLSALAEQGRGHGSSLKIIGGALLHWDL